MGRATSWGSLCWTSCGLFAATLALTSMSVAQAPGVSKSALAESLFKEGRNLMERGEYALACDKFAESQRLDPGIGTQLNLGVCNEKLGRLASAWSVFEEVRSLARSQGREKEASFAQTHIEQLQGKLSRLVIVVSPQAHVDGLEVKLDGVALGEPIWGTRMPIDPGRHVVEVLARGHKSWRRELTIGNVADNQTVRVPVLEVAPGAAPEIGSKGEGSLGVSHNDSETTQRASSNASSAAGVDSGGADSSQATWGYVSGGVGLVALGIGGYFGMRAISTWDKHLEHCKDGWCDAEGGKLGRDADRFAIWSDVGIGLGAVGVVAGTVLVLTAPSSEPSTEVQGRRVRFAPWVSKGMAGAQVGGAW